MKIYVQTCRCDGKTYAFEVGPSESIADVKAKIQARLDVPAHQLRLFFDKHPEQRRDNQRMTVFIRDAKGAVVAIDTEPSETIEKLKLKFQDKEGIPPDQQRIILAGMQLEDDRTLSDYGIGHKALLHMWLRLRGC